MISRINAAAIEHARQTDPRLFLALQQLVNGTDSITARIQTGTAVLVAGVAVVYTAAVQTSLTAASAIFMAYRNPSGTTGTLSAPDSKQASPSQVRPTSSARD